MKSLFDLEGPLAQFLLRLTDLAIINVLTLLCCIPVVTVGPAVAAAHKVTQNMVFDSGGGIVKSYFHAFKDNLKQGIIVWLVSALLAGVLISYYFLVSVLASGVLRTILYVILAVLAIVLMGILVFLYPMMSRYDNKLGQHFRNSILLALFHFPKMLVMIAVDLIPVAFAWIAPDLFLSFGFFWLILGFAFLILLHSYLMKPIFVDLEEKQSIAAAAAQNGANSFVDASEATPEEE